MTAERRQTRGNIEPRAARPFPTARRSNANHTNDGGDSPRGVSAIVFHRYIVHIAWSHFHANVFVHSKRNQPHSEITNHDPITVSNSCSPVQRAHFRQMQQLYTRLPGKPRTLFHVPLEFQRFQEPLQRTTVDAIVFNGCCTDSAPYNARIMPSRGSCTRIGVATLRASCAASHSHAGPHRARNEPSGGVNEIRNTTGLSSTIVEPHRHD